MRIAAFTLLQALMGAGSLLTMSSIQAAGSAPDAASASNSFAFDCLAELQRENGNIAFSPFSAWTALTMTSGGAAGKTHDEMAAVLHLPEHAAFHQQAAGWMDELSALKGIDLKIANRLWPDEKFIPTPSFVELTQKHYHAGLEALNYAKDAGGARKHINKWVEKQTNNRIKDLLQPQDVTSDTKMILTNAVYFKAAWAKEFMPETTTALPFKLPDGRVQQSPLMLQKGMIPYYENEKFQAAKLPYKGEGASMIIVLPKTGHSASEGALVSKTRFDQVRSGLKPALVTLRLPRFSVNQRVSMAPLLEKLGMKTVFTDAADFSRMCTGEPLKVGSVIHQAFVEVGEKGTEAAAATAVAVLAGSAMKPPESKFFIVDHPFLFFIVDERHGGILFVGRVETPELAR